MVQKLMFSVMRATLGMADRVSTYCISMLTLRRRWML